MCFAHASVGDGDMTESSSTHPTDLPSESSEPKLRQYRLRPTGDGQRSLEALYRDRGVVVGERGIAQAVALFSEMREVDSKMKGIVDNMLSCLYHCVHGSKQRHKRRVKKVKRSSEEIHGPHLQHMQTRAFLGFGEVVSKEVKQEQTRPTSTTPKASNSSEYPTPIYSSPPSNDRDREGLFTQPQSTLQPVAVFASAPRPSLSGSDLSAVNEVGGDDISDNADEVKDEEMKNSLSEEDDVNRVMEQVNEVRIPNPLKWDRTDSITDLSPTQVKLVTGNVGSDKMRTTDQEKMPLVVNTVDGRGDTVEQKELGTTGAGTVTDKGDNLLKPITNPSTKPRMGSPRSRYAKELASPFTKIMAHTQRQQQVALMQGDAEAKRLLANADGITDKETGAGEKEIGDDDKRVTIEGGPLISATRRRHSADAFHLRVSYERHVNRTRRSMHHRKSECEEALAEAASQARQYVEMKNSQNMSTSGSRYKQGSFTASSSLSSAQVSPTAALQYMTNLNILECRYNHPHHHHMHHNCPVAHATAALCHSQGKDQRPTVGGEVGHTFSSDLTPTKSTTLGTRRTYSFDAPYLHRSDSAGVGVGTHYLNSLIRTNESSYNLSGTIENWPTSITSHLTSSQPLYDRLQMLWLLEEVLTTSQHHKALLADEDKHSPDLVITDQQYKNKHIQPSLMSTPSASSAPQQPESPSVPQSTPCLAALEKQLFEAGLEMNDLSGLPVKKTRKLKLVTGAWSIPRPDKVEGGEDAYFFNDDIGFFGVSDGVGEWGEMGCNPKHFAEELMQGAHQEAAKQVEIAHRYAELAGQKWPPDEQPRNKETSGRAQRALDAGFQSAKSFGSATALVAGLDYSGSMLGVANLGDSALVILRRENRHHRQLTVCCRTKEQQHFFNCPYQLSLVPAEKDLPELEKKGMHVLAKAIANLHANYRPDLPEMADRYDVQVQEGDLLVGCTDGVLDNLFDHELTSLLSIALSPFEARALELAGLDEHAGLGHVGGLTLPLLDPKVGYATPPRHVARAIAEAAFFRSVDSRAKTPFSKGARKNGTLVSGGKMDDITVTASWVIAADD
eukprot:GHVN01082454.1.p1 GENE.GHVN01082454.1~~GHVN01082454.1.p1  ORF type:complete len:1071 (+),score=247.75 GHVN01082454.1:215-3427(+)